jgi:hypothetical protein
MGDFSWLYEVAAWQFQAGSNYLPNVRFAKTKQTFGNRQIEA